MKKQLRIVFIALVVCLLSACRTAPEPDFDFVPQPGDTLTQKETDALVWHAANFVSHAKKVRLTKAQRKLIQEQKPKVKIKYLAPKYGHVHITWTIADNGWVEISGTGTLVEKQAFPWQLEIKILDEQDALGDGKKGKLKKSR